MGLIKEYVDQAVQTETDAVLSPYADPAVVLAAPPLICQGLEQEKYAPHSTPELTPLTSDSAYIIPQSPISPVLPSLVSRRLSKRGLVRYPPGEIPNRRIASMPEKKSEIPSIYCDEHGKRVVSMPDRIRPVLEPSAKLSQSPSTTASDSSGPYGGHRERVRVFAAPSDVPQTPSPPSSPESLLIIAAGAQLPEGFLRKKYSPEPLVEEDEDWVTWANSPPRPIPALHGPLSLPYARCPSGAEGTIIEESDNVAQMIWGLGPDDQSHNQIRTEGPASHPDNTPNALSHGPSHTLPRLHKKRVPTQQVSKSSRSQISTHPTHTKPSLARTQRQTHDERPGLSSQLSSEIEIHRDIASGLQWNEGQSTPVASDNLPSSSNVLPIDNNRVLEWQIARLQHVLRTSFGDMDSLSTYPGRLDPIFPASVASGFPQSYPRIFVEPRPNESVTPAAKQTPIELAQQYRQQQLCRQALQKQKLQVQSILPTPPNSSSPQWSSHFSPYLTYCSTLSPELVGSPEYPVSAPSQNYRSGAHASQYLRHVFDQHEYSGADFDTITNIPSAKAVPNAITSTPSSRQCSSSSSTLAKYIKQLQALSPIAHFSPLQQVPPPNVPLPPLAPIDETTVGPLQVVPTPPSPESPRTLSRGSSCHNVHSFALTRPVQRRLSSVPEEDSTFLGLSTSVSQSRLYRQIATDNNSSSHDGTIGPQKHHLEAFPIDITRKMAVPDVPKFESNVRTPPIAFHETSPVKVRLPVNKEHGIREQVNGHQEQNKGHRKKHRYKKLRGPTTTNEHAQPRGLVG